MATDSLDQHCSCDCQQSKLSVTGEPLFRMVCHCEICQKVLGGPSDSVILRARDVETADKLDLNFQRYRPPPNVNRGKCLACEKVLVEYFQLIPGVKYAIVPCKNFEDGATLPAPSFHMFYNRRKADYTDNLPKYNGYWPSQLAFMRKLLATALRK